MPKAINNQRLGRRERGALAIIVILLVLSAAIALWPSHKRKIGQLTPDKQSVSESQKLLAMNNQVISQALAADTQPVPSISKTDQLVGSLDAPVKVIVYEDYSSLYSAEFASTTDRLLEEYKDKVVVAFRPYFLASEPLSRDSALAVACAAKQGRFEEMRAALFAAVRQDRLAAANIQDYAAKAGLNTKKFKSCLNDSQAASALAFSVDRARQADVFGAPTIFLNSRLIPGARPWEDYKDSEGRPNEGLNSLVAKELK